MIYNGRLKRNKFIFFKIYIHNIQKSYDNKIINENEYDIIRGIDDYGCIMVYDYLKRKNFKNTTIITNDKRSFFDMLCFSKLLNTKKRNYIFKRSFKNGLLSDLQLSYVEGNVNIKTKRVNTTLLNDYSFRSNNINNIVIRSIIDLSKKEIKKIINSNIIDDVKYELNKLNTSDEEVFNNLFNLYCLWFNEKHKK